MSVLPAVLLATLAGAEEPDPVSYWREVRPLLTARCAGCHQPAKAKGSVDVTSPSSLLAAEDVVRPGAPAKSLLLEVVSPDGGAPPSMPPDGPPLTDDEVALLESWIAAGAADDTPEGRASGGAPDVYARLPVITDLDVSPDGSRFAVAGSGEVLVHRYDGGIEARYAGLSERVEGLAFSPDGARLAVIGGNPARFGEVQVWNVETGALALSLQVTFDTLRGVSWSPDGTRIAFGGADRSLRAIDAATGEQVLFQGAHEDWVLDTTWSTDASHLISVSRDRSMKLVKVSTSQFIDNITSITPGALKGGLAAVARHPARDELLAAGADGVPRLYRMYREKKRVIGDDYNLIEAFRGLPGRLSDVQWLPGSDAFLSASSDEGRGHVRRYAIGTPEAAWTYDAAGGVYALAVHPDGDRVLCAGQSGVVVELDAATGEVRREIVPVPVAVADAAEVAR
ncbi:MAG: c-type cytochrome domain-containing protein [Planctomycetota bacterium]